MRDGERIFGFETLRDHTCSKEHASKPYVTSRGGSVTPDDLGRGPARGQVASVVGGGGGKYGAESAEGCRGCVDGLEEGMEEPGECYEF